MKKMNILAVLFVFIALLAMSAQAWTTTVNTPGASATVAGSAYAFNCTWSGTEYLNVTNATMTFSCTNSVNSSTTTIATNNTIGNETTWLPTWDSTAAEDGTSCTFTCTFYNDTNASETKAGTRTGATIDNTAPVVTYGGATPADDLEVREDSCITIYASSTNAIEGDQTLTVNRDSKSWQSYTVTETGTGNTVTKQVCGMDRGHTYTYYYTLTDGTNSTTGSSRDYLIKGGGATSSGDVQKVTEAAQSQKNVPLVIGLAVLVVLAIIGGIVLVYKKF
jgi:hypothetical protein